MARLQLLLAILYLLFVWAIVSVNAKIDPIKPIYTGVQIFIKKILLSRKLKGYK